MLGSLGRLIADERGQGLAEYSLILSLVALVCVGATRAFGAQVGDTLTSVGGSLP